MSAPTPTTSRSKSKTTKSKTKTAAGSSSSVRKPAKSVPSVNDDSKFRVNFEVHGKVQGVHFRKHTQLQATSLGLRGWCQNTEYNTVIGSMEGPRFKIEKMKQWLKSTGSPKSIISGADFKDTKCDEYTLSAGFQIIK